MSLQHRMVTALSMTAFLGLTSCAAILDNGQGPLQPQMVSGPCEVKKFFFLSLRSVPAEMTVRNTGESCTMTLVNPALNAVINAALLTGVPQHGRASAGLTPGSRQAVVSYVPVPGYAGPDKFDVTLEPNAVGITFNVMVTR
ncbi:MAG: hypothetical protein M3N26_01815 [Pseudomonadota bacterium]|nr:hypothetical protein [Pseudomonadota bacterium]